MPALRKLLPLLLIALAMAGFFIFGLDKYISFDVLRENEARLHMLVAEMPVVSGLVYMVLYATATALSLPIATVLTVSGGLIFGTLIGGSLTVIGATTGACVIFLAAHSALRDTLVAKAGPRVKQFEAGFQKDAVSYLLTVRLIPIFPFFLVNIAAALVGAPFRIFALTTLFGIAPGTFIYASIGNGVSVVLAGGGIPDLGIIFDPEIFLPLTGLGVLVLVPVLWRRFQKHAAANATTTEHDGGQDER